MALRRTTIGELGAKLPIGTLTGRQLTKDFQLRPYKSRIDRAVGDWLEANAAKYSSPAVREAARVAKFCSLICSQFGDKAFALTAEGDSTPEAEVTIYSRWYADIMYLYVFARIQALGPQLEVSFVCPRCKKSAKGIYDLNTMEVDVIDDAADLEKWIDLTRPFKDRNTQRISRLKMRPITWATMLKPGVFSGVMDQITQAGLEDSICGTDANPETGLTLQEIDEIERIDVVKLNHETQDLAAGLELKTSVACPHDNDNGEPCGHVDEDAMNWTFDYFFGSSLPMSATASS
jgi:hypothetical protein